MLASSLLAVISAAIGKIAINSKQSEKAINQNYNRLGFQRLLSHNLGRKDVCTATFDAAQISDIRSTEAFGAGESVYQTSDALPVPWFQQGDEVAGKDWVVVSHQVTGWQDDSGNTLTGMFNYQVRLRRNVGNKVIGGSNEYTVTIPVYAQIDSAASPATVTSCVAVANVASGAGGESSLWNKDNDGTTEFIDYTAANGGYVGIGTAGSVPVAKLEVDTSGATGLAAGVFGSSITTGTNSVAIGDQTVVRGDNSLAVGYFAETGSDGDNSIALGAPSYATGASTFAGGAYTGRGTWPTYVTGDNSFGFAGGTALTSTISGDMAFGFGSAVIASGDYSFAFGLSTSAMADYSAAIGQWTSVDAGSDYSFVAGNGNQITGTDADGSVVFGENNLNAGMNGFVAGETNDNQVSSDYSAIVGGLGNISSNGYSVLAGQGNSNERPYNFLAGQDNTAFDTAHWSVATGYNNSLEGQRSFVAGYNNTVKAYHGGAFGYNNTVGSSTGMGASIAIGNSNNAPHINNIIIGTNNTTGGNIAVALGYNNVTVGNYGAVSIGNDNVNSSATKANWVMGESNLVDDGVDKAIILGSNMRASHNGSMLIGDAYAGAGDLASTAANSFTSRFLGGYKFLVDNSTVAMEISGTYLTSQKNETQTCPAVIAFFTELDNACYWKDPNGVVHLEGVVRSINGFMSGPGQDACWGSVTLFTLPAGYQPTESRFFRVKMQYHSTCNFTGNGPHIEINSSGQVIARNIGDLAHVTLSGVQFVAEQ
jgi:hypothetical protein